MIKRLVPVLTRSIADYWDNIVVLVVANVIWALSLLPAVGVFFIPGLPVRVLFMFVLLVVITGPTTIGLYNLTADFSRLERLELSEFFKGIRQFYRRGWLLMLLNVIFVGVTLFNINFYQQAEFKNTPLPLLSFIWFYLIFAWFVLQIYLWPIAVRTEGKFTVRLLFRNAILVSLKYLGFSLALGLLFAIGLAGSYLVTLLPTITIGATLQAVISNRALTEVLVVERERAPADDTDEKSPEKDLLNAVAINEEPAAPPSNTTTGSTRNLPPGVKRRLGANPEAKDK